MPSFPFSMNKFFLSQGFTLVELVTIIVLIGILSAVVVPRFITSDGFSEYSDRDHIIAAARITQQRAMYDHSSVPTALFNACFRFRIASDVLTVESFNGTDYDPIGPNQEWLDGISLSPGTVADTTIYFDGLGNAFTDDCDGVSPVGNPTTINVSGLQVEIYSTGFIRAI